jgi:hypothetical protein
MLQNQENKLHLGKTPLARVLSKIQLIFKWQNDQGKRNIVIKKSKIEFINNSSFALQIKLLIYKKLVNFQQFLKGLYFPSN